MPRKTLDLGNAKPVPDIVSYGRQGPTRRDRLSLEQLHIRRTIERTPEVRIKVLSKGGHDIKGVRRHIEYLSRCFAKLRKRRDIGWMTWQQPRRHLDFSQPLRQPMGGAKHIRRHTSEGLQPTR